MKTMASLIIVCSSLSDIPVIIDPTFSSQRYCLLGFSRYLRIFGIFIGNIVSMSTANA